MQNFSFLSLDKKPIALQIYHWIYHQSLSQMMGLSSGPIGLQWETSICFIMFSKKEEVETLSTKINLRFCIGNPAGIGQGTGFGLRERDRDGIGLGHYRLRANIYLNVEFAGHGLLPSKATKLIRWLFVL